MKNKNRQISDLYDTSGTDSYEQGVEILKSLDKPVVIIREDVQKANIDSIGNKIESSRPQIIYDVADELKHIEESKLKKQKDIPANLIDIDGFIGEVADHTYANAPVPNKVMAFVGALSLMSYLVGRKVKGISGVRPNMYLLGLGYSTSGKDFPRRINDEIMHAIGKSDEIGDSLGSAEGLEDALFRTRSLLLQTDEIDGMLESIKIGKEVRYGQMMNILLKMFTSSSSSYKMRIKAGQDSIGTIFQPSLTLFGTAVPTYYYNALNEKMLNNGFFGRMLVFQSYKTEKFRQGEPKPVPKKIIKLARFWRSYNTKDTNNLGDLSYCDPIQIPSDPDCSQLIQTFSDKVYDIKSKYEESGNNGAVTVWGRAIESVFKLSLLRACSEAEFNDDYNHVLKNEIRKDHIEWAIELVEFLINNMMLSLENIVGDNPIKINAKKLHNSISETKKGYATMTYLKKKTKLDSKEFEQATKELEADELIQIRYEKINDSQKKSVVYFLT